MYAYGAALGELHALSRKYENPSVKHWTHMEVFDWIEMTLAELGFDKERYERLLSLTSQTYSELLSIPEETVKARFIAEIGYITPKVETNAAIFNDKGEILLMERFDGSGWCMPCGFVEPNETPAEGVIREVREETGLDGKIKQLVGVFTRKPEWENRSTHYCINCSFM